jgi:hypothetical protein
VRESCRVLTAMDDIVLVEVVDGFQDLSYGCRSVLFGEAALFADAVEQLSTGCELCHDVVLVLCSSVSLCCKVFLLLCISLWTRTNQRT